jgi:hypothetical protein
MFAGLFLAFDRDLRRAFWAAVVAGFAPLAWFTAGRPMSDITGLALAVFAQVLIVRAWKGGATQNSLISGALVAGLAAGVRVQTAALTVPVLLVALVSTPAVTVRTQMLAVVAAAAGVLLWGVPLLISAGGLTNYLAAFGTQAGEDLAGVVMLWTTPKPKVAFHAVVNAFVWPWGRLALGVIVVAIAAVGAVVAALRTPGRILILAALFAPYAIVHLLWQETLTMRYALPLVAPVAYLFVRGAESFRASPFLEIAVVAVALVMTVPQSTAFAKGSPAFAAMTDAVHQAGPIGGHAGMRRLHEWLETGVTQQPFLRAPHGFEWLTLVETWQKNPETPIQFLANPKRTDYRTLFDPFSRHATDYKWPFAEWPHLGGARPGAVERIDFSPPGWMLDRGWATSAEMAGVAETEGYGPHRRPSVAWLRTRNESATLMIGGRNLADPGGPRVRLALSIEGKPLDELNVDPGYFLRTIQIPGGMLQGTGYLPLSVSVSTDKSQPTVAVKLDQFDLQPAGRVMVGALDGWHEPEYNRSTGRDWRWASERATLWVRPVGRDVILTIDVESPGRYFDAAPKVRISVGGQEIGARSPSNDFRWEVTLPSALIDRANGSVVLESDKWFVPGERDGSADKRHLALRVYSYSVR